MPAVDPDAPWWINTIVLLFALALTSGSSAWVAIRGTRKRVAETAAKVTTTAADVAVVKEEVKNSHQSVLRHDLDRAIERAETAAGLAEQSLDASRSAALAAERTEGFARDIDRSVRALGHSIERSRTELGASIGELEHTIPRRIDRAIQRHVDEHHTKELS